MIRKILWVLVWIEIFTSLALAAGGAHVIAGKIKPKNDFLPISAEVWMENDASLGTTCETFVHKSKVTRCQADLQDFNPGWQNGEVVVLKIEKADPAENGAGFYGNTSMVLDDTLGSQDFPDVVWGAKNNPNPTPIPQAAAIANPVSGEVIVTWEAAAGTHLLGYNLYRSSGGTNFSRINTNLVTGEIYSDNAINSSINPPIGGQSYYYAVKIVFGITGESKETIYRSLKSDQVAFPDLPPADVTTPEVTTEPPDTPADPPDTTDGETPSITNITPDAGVAGSRITIIGNGLGAIQGSSKVLFESVKNGAQYEARIVLWNDTLIEAIIPVAADAEGYAVKVIRISLAGGAASEQASNGIGFRITAASVAGIANVWPNPFNAGAQSLNISFDNTSGATSIGIYIYDSVGRLAHHNLISSTTARWNGTDQQGGVVGDGIYLLRIVNAETKSLIAKGKILVVKR